MTLPQQEPILRPLLPEAAVATPEKPERADSCKPGFGAEPAAGVGIVAIQFLTALLLAALLAASSSGWPALAAFCGGLVAVVGTLLQRRHVRRAERLAGLDPRRNLGVLLRCELERLLLGSVMLAIALVVLKLPALPLIGAFLLVTLVPVFETSIERLTKKWQAIRKP